MTYTPSVWRLEQAGEEASGVIGLNTAAVTETKLLAGLAGGSLYVIELSIGGTGE